MAAVLVQLEGQGGHPGVSRKAALLLQPGPGRHRPDPCNNPPDDVRKRRPRVPSEKPVQLVFIAAPPADLSVLITFAAQQFLIPPVGALARCLEVGPEPI